MAEHAHPVDIAYVETTTSDGLVHAGARFAPADAEPLGSVIHVHGMAGGCLDNAWTWTMGRHVAGSGWELVTGNHRGTATFKQIDVRDGDGNPGGTHVGTAIELVAESPMDVAAWREVARTDRHVLSGHSLGASKVVLSLLDRPEGVAGLLLLAPADMVALADAYPDTGRLVAAAHELERAGTPEALVPGEWGGWSLISARTLLERSVRGAPCDVIDASGTAPADGPLARVDVPVLQIGGSEDTCLVLPMKAGMENLEAALIASPDVQTHCLGGAAHQMEGSEETVGELVAGWLTTLA